MPPRSPEHLANLRRAALAYRALPTTKTFDATKAWRGGETAGIYASILCPVGFVREHRVYYGPPEVNKNHHRAVMDFAHVEGKVDIELDGPYHLSSKEDDAKRDIALRALGWKIIRIKHE